MICPIDKENLSLTFLFMLFFKSQNSYYKHLLKDKNVTIQQIPILMKLSNHEYVYQKDISRDLRIDNALLTRSLRKLEDNNYIQRTEDDDNRRQNKISLTYEGKVLAKTLLDKGIEREEEIMKNSNFTREELIELLLQLLENSKEFNDNL